MRTFTLIARATAMVLLCGLSPPGFAQGQPQTIMKVDVTKVSTGFRASKIVGAEVINGAKESIGKIDDVIISSDGKVPYAILSVGGFLGLGTRLIAVPYDTLQVVDKRLML